MEIEKLLAVYYREVTCSILSAHLRFLQICFFLMRSSAVHGRNKERHLLEEALFMLGLVFLSDQGRLATDGLPTGQFHTLVQKADICPPDSCLDTSWPYFRQLVWQEPILLFEKTKNKNALVCSAVTSVSLGSSFKSCRMFLCCLVSSLSKRHCVKSL